MVAITGTQSSKAPKHTQHEAADGVRLSPGPFIGIVKNNIDPMRAGRLSVWIPELGGNADDSASWRTVSYCTPFYGVTSPAVRSQDQSFTGSPHSYGMWFVPPDIDVKVMCMFVNGDPFRGYWFGCIPEFPNAHMVPGMSSASWHGGGPEPVVEYNDFAPGAIPPDYYKRPSTPHDYQTQVWSRQGLLQDPVRGPGISSSQRETPSRVFGISTPGPELSPPTGPTDQYQQVDDKIPARQGGHQFIMDDGDVNGNSQLIRLRTSNGNMLLMNDSAGFIYLINSKGSAWFEMDAGGSIKVYSEGQVQMHATSGFAFDTPGSFSVNATSISLSAMASISLGSMQVGIKGTMGVSLGSTAGPISLAGMKVSVNATTCVGITGMTHVDIKGLCTTLNTTPPTPSPPSMPFIPMPANGPTHEPYGGHTASKTNSPVSSKSYAAANGVPGGVSGNYGAAASFGATPNNPLYYGAYTNSNGPIKFNTGLQGSLIGQAANLGIAAALNAYDKNATSYKNVNLNLPVAANGFAIDVTKPGSANATGLSPGERQNNPGDLNSILQDPFAIGQNNGLNVYQTPEDGIAALALELDLIQADGARTVADFIQGYIARKGKLV